MSYKHTHSDTHFTLAALQGGSDGVKLNVKVLGSGAQFGERSVLCTAGVHVPILTALKWTRDILSVLPSVITSRSLPPISTRVLMCESSALSGP